MRKPGFFISALLATALIAPQLADARGGFRGRAPRMNFGGGGMHGGNFHGGGFNGPNHFELRYHPSGNYPHPQPSGGNHHPPGPGPGPPGPGPHPPGPGPHPPGPGPHPPGLPPGPHGWGPLPPGPYYPGYWGPAAAWTAATATAIAIGTVVATVPAECTNFVVSGITYKDCSGRWFAPRYDGHTVVYIAVADPR